MLNYVLIAVALKYVRRKKHDDTLPSIFALPSTQIHDTRNHTSLSSVPIPIVTVLRLPNLARLRAAQMMSRNPLCVECLSTGILCYCLWFFGGSLLAFATFTLLRKIGHNPNVVEEVQDTAKANKEEEIEKETVG